MIQNGQVIHPRGCGNTINTSTYGIQQGIST